MKLWKKCLLLMVPVMGLASASGCVVTAHPVGPVVTVEPGYYYDDGYWDVYHVWHPRVYYYYHGGRWAPRSFAPRGVVVRPRFR